MFKSWARSRVSVMVRFWIYLRFSVMARVSVRFVVTLELPLALGFS